MFCMLLTTESGLFTVRIYLIAFTTQMVCVFALRNEVKLYIVFRLVFVCKGLISCVYYMTLRVLVVHIFRFTKKAIVYSVTNRLVIQRKLKIKCNYVYALNLYIKRNVICTYI